MRPGGRVASATVRLALIMALAGVGLLAAGMRPARANTTEKLFGLTPGAALAWTCWSSARYRGSLGSR